jgi:hypothetical protein
MPAKATQNMPRQAVRGELKKLAAVTSTISAEFIFCELVVAGSYYANYNALGCR